ncbi:C2H2 finger domain transcription factor [Phlyctema vagabunda]|uniref:C2H2 finger domain transcription factor n=1 Tax=Phlyctema vagabunda TaxID=108571 RepID=A0ABR4P2B4_9HELO
MPSSTNSRNSSISSASSSASSTATKKKFSCSFPSCGKSFSRSEHLHRHALNHKEGNNTCLRCSAHFRRRDLLDRHMARHKEKDDEAGGEGLGFLATRKRLWRDADGKIVNARRPYTAETPASKRRCSSRADDHKASTTSKRRKSEQDKIDLEHMMRNNALPSPISMSAPSLGSASPPAFLPTMLSEYPDPEAFGERHDQWPEMKHIPSGPTSIGSPREELDALHDEEPWMGLPSAAEPHIIHPPNPESDYVPHESWGSQPFQTFMGAMAELPYEDIFKPESGMYDWQHWNSEVLMSRRRERYELFDESKQREYKVPFGLRC